MDDLLTSGRILKLYVKEPPVGVMLVQHKTEDKWTTFVCYVAMILDEEHEVGDLDDVTPKTHP